MSRTGSLSREEAQMKKALLLIILVLEPVSEWLLEFTVNDPLGICTLPI